MSKSDLDNYPQDIFRKKNYRGKLPLNQLLNSYPNIVVNRRVDNKEIFRYSADGRREIIDDQILGQKVLGLSVNLLGGAFKDYHATFRPLEAGLRKDWTNSNKIPKRDLDFEIKSNTKQVYFKLCNVVTLTFPYSNFSINNNEQYLFYKNNSERTVRSRSLKIDSIIIEEFRGEGKEHKVLAFLKVIHYPTTMNFWHLQFDVFRTIDNSKVEESDKKDFKRINRSLRKYLFNILEEEITLNYQIHKKFYIKKTCFLKSLFNID